MVTNRCNEHTQHRYRIVLHNVLKCWFACTWTGVHWRASSRRGGAAAKLGVSGTLDHNEFFSWVSRRTLNTTYDHFNDQAGHGGRVSTARHQAMGHWIRGSVASGARIRRLALFTLLLAIGRFQSKQARADLSLLDVFPLFWRVRHRLPLPSVLLRKIQPYARGKPLCWQKGRLRLASRSVWVVALGYFPTRLSSTALLG